MKFIKSIFSKLFNLIGKLFGYDHKAEKAKTAAVEKQAEVTIAEVKAETARMEAESAVKIKAINEKEALQVKCHETFLRITSLAKLCGHSLSEAVEAAKADDLVALEKIEEAMVLFTYKDPAKPTAGQQKKQSKVKHIGRRKAA
jgi:hypothetical protein